MQNPDNCYISLHYGGVIGLPVPSTRIEFTCFSLFKLLWGGHPARPNLLCKCHKS
jgi:hypothetical protein